MKWYKVIWNVKRYVIEMIWINMKLLKWQSMIWYDMKMIWNDMIQYVKCMKLYNLISCDMKWNKIIWSDLKLHEVILIDMKWYDVIKNDMKKSLFILVSVGSMSCLYLSVCMSVICYSVCLSYGSLHVCHMLALSLSVYLFVSYVRYSICVFVYLSVCHILACLSAICLSVTC